MEKTLTLVDALNKTLEAPAVDPVLLQIANKYLQGQEIADIADELEVSRDRVVSILEKAEVKRYIDGVMSSQGYLNRVRRMDLINEVIEQKVAEARDTEMFSRKDLLDWLKHIAELEKDLQPKEAKQPAAGPAVAVQISNSPNYDRLMGEIIDVSTEGPRRSDDSSSGD